VSSALRAPRGLGFALILLAAIAIAIAGAAARAHAQGATEAPSRAPSASAATVLILGDSISAAYGMALEQGWVALLAERLTGERMSPAIINASISGDTSAGGLRRLPALLARHEPDLVVLELGGNDGLRGYPTAQLRDNLHAMASLATEAGAQVLILPMEIPPNYGSRYTRAFRKAFRAAAETSGAELLPFILEDIATQPALMQDDGIHPTVAAQAMIADVVQPFLAPYFPRAPKAPSAPQARAGEGPA